jgi:hypothetical protein
MAYEIKDNSGSIFKNTKKEKETHPDSTGSALIDGVEYWVSGWTKTSEKAGKWVSLSFKRKDEVNASGKAKAQSAIAQSAEITDDEIPF